MCIVGTGWGGNGAVAQSTTSDQPSATCPAGGQCFTDVPTGNPFYAFVNRIYQQDLVTGYLCGGPGEPCDAQHRPYYRPVNNVTRQQMAKFIDNARHQPGIDIEVSGGTAPIIAHNNTGTAISAFSVSGQALLAESDSQSAIYAQTNTGSAVSGYATGAGGIGLQGTGGSDADAKGVVGHSDSGFGMYASSNSGVGIYGASTSATGIYGASTGGTAVYGHSDTGAGVSGSSTSDKGVAAHSDSGYGIYASSTSGTGIYGASTGGTAVSGNSNAGVGVWGFSSSNTGTIGASDSADGVYGESNTGNAIHGVSPGGNWAGYFEGNVNVTGTCCAMSEAYTRIDDPVDPANKYLNQPLVQSADLSSVINGNITLNSNGEATVAVPAWFEASTGDYRYSLTAVGAPGPDLYIARKLAGNQFKIAGGKPDAEVSWQVTGIRNDPYAKQHPISVEQDKPANEQGKYLHPTEYGQPESAGVNYKGDPHKPTEGKP
jgi:hypothetical protein